MTAHQNDWDTSAQRSESSSSITSSSNPEIVALKAKMVEINQNLMKVLRINHQVKAITPSYESCGGPHAYNDCSATVGQTQNTIISDHQGLIRIKTKAIQIKTTKIGIKETIVQILRGITKEETNSSKEPVMSKTCLQLIKPWVAILKNMQTNMTSLTSSNLELKNMFGQFMKINTASSLGSKTLPSNAITNLKEDLKGITTQSEIAYKGPTIPTTFSSPKVVERETDVTKDTVPPTNNESTKDVQALVVQVKTQVPNFEPVVALVVEPVEALLRDDLILMPTFKSLLSNKEKLFKLARTPLNKHCSAVILKKLLEKLRDPGKFVIPCDFLLMDECLALADLGTSINLMPLSVWNKLSLFELSPTCMTLKLADRSISHPIGVAEGVSVKVGKFHFLVDFVVIDFDADRQVPLILERPILKTGRALIDVYEGELTIRVGNKAVTFNLDQTSRYSSNYDAESINRIDVIDVACEEYSQEVLGFSVSGNPTLSMKPIVCTSSPTLTPFGDSDFLLEETDAFLAIEDKPISPEIDDS
uniref:Reverse transcriptase domain-containing protein n=1 Tax=Tanacetum cinerariifolium TaxID=118510 RepID=A0A699IH14_TANCI|nr:reverse transcriptase domain-containing protein [Tanacetum cinerariifolium]